MREEVGETENLKMEMTGWGLVQVERNRARRGEGRTAGRCEAGETPHLTLCETVAVKKRM